jgi:hypothetical protein
MKKRLNERTLTRKFLTEIISLEPINKINSSSCHICCIDPCICHEYHNDTRYEDNAGESSREMNMGEDGIISKEELYSHFDLDQDGVVTGEEYAKHIDFHAAHPETLDKYRNVASRSLESVPCKSSYEKCGSYYMSDPESMDDLLQPILDATGASCKSSAIQSMLDVVNVMKECGIV